MTERWRTVAGYEGLYEVSDCGRVRSLDRSTTRRNGVPQRIHGRIKAQTPNHDGRLRVRLERPGSYRSYQVHRLVLEAFVGPCPPGLECRHSDGNTANNCLDNLRWGTPSENAHDKVRHGTHNMTRRTHCPRGHLLTPPNLVASRTGENRRRCLACARARAYVHYHPDLRPDLQAIADSYHQSIDREVA